MTKIVLIGNPNTGKTTLFNTITKSNERVANYSGVTVSESKKTVKINGKEYEVVDLPGLYSINASGDDEKVTKRFLEQNPDAYYIFVANALDLQKNVNLLYELANLKLKVGVFVNAYNVDKSKINEEALKEILNVPLMVQNATKGRSKILSFIETLDSVDNFISRFDLQKLKTICNIEISEQKIDKILLNPFWGRVIFVLAVVFILFFSLVVVEKLVGEPIENYLEKLRSTVTAILLEHKLNLLASFFSSVLVSSLGAVLVFLPELFSVLFGMYLLEEIGYLPRVATLFNFRLSEVGLNGQSVFGLVCGVGCTTTGVIATRNIQSTGVRCRTVQLLPFIGCSAKLPIVLYLVSKIGASYGLSLVLFLIVVAVGLVMVKSLSKPTEEPMIIELPRLKMPSVKQLFKKSLSIIVEFSVRVFTSLLIVSVVLWGLSLIKLGSQNKTLLDYAGDSIAKLFIPLGLNDGSVALSMLAGLVAKENILSTLSMFGVPAFSKFQIVSFIVFILLYPPCIPALKCVRVDFGRKMQIKMFVTQFLLAYILSMFVYTFSIYLGLAWGLILSLLLTILLILIYSKIFLPKIKPCTFCKLTSF